MRKIFTAILFFISVSLFSQDEKRLALVIGNANYDKVELKNPVNDARLIASTLDSLDFDVILATNLEDQRSFLNKVREFGSQRDQYDVGFVYYAGHGVQISGENYLLPTKEIYESENDIEDYAVNVSKIMKYLTAVTDQVNILILDACRDNPFEQNWNATRSQNGQGLAKIPPPTGSLIAFSTDAGNTAADGNGDNSIYCKSLVKNMMLENTTLDQVFRNVRTDVLRESNKMQRPIESSQLTGQAFYLVKSDYDNTFTKIEEILDQFNNPYYVEKDYTPELYDSLEKLNIIISRGNSNARALLLMSKIYSQLDQDKKALFYVNNAIKADRNFIIAYQFRASLHFSLGNNELAVKDRNTVINLDPNNKTNYMDKMWDYYSESKYNEVIEVINKMILMFPNDPEIYRTKANTHMFLLENELAIESYSKAIELDPKNGFLYMQKGDFLARELNKHEEALVLYEKANDLKPDEPSPYYAMIYSNFALNNLNEIPQLCNKIISLDINDPEPYFHLSKYYKLQNDYLKSISYITRAINKLNENDNYGVNSELGVQEYSFYLLLERSKLYSILNISILECQDLNDALENISKYLNLNDDELWKQGIYKTENYIENKFDEIKKLISNSCN